MSRGARSKRYHVYRRAVWAFTNVHHPLRVNTTRQHHVPISRGFSWGIPPDRIGSRENVSYLPLQENLAQGTRLDERACENLRRWGYGHLLKPTDGETKQPDEVAGEPHSAPPT